MKDKLLAIYNRIKDSVVNLFKRFPITSTYIILQYITLSLMVEWDYFNVHPKQLFFLALVVVTSYALIFHSIIIQLMSERFGWDEKKKWLMNLGSVVLTSAVFALFTYKDLMAFDTLGGNFTGNLYRLGVFIALSGLLTVFVPFLKDKENKTWWNFTMYSLNKAAISMLYSIVLYAGIAIALGALESFWKITLFDHQYELLPIFTFILFAQLNFLSDVFDFSYKGKYELPKFLAIFGKFILTPLIIIYTAILYPYMFSFPFKAEWPSNQSTFIIVAMISMIYAVMYIFWNTSEKDNDFKFVNWFTKIANAIAIPTVLFWAYSMWVRIDAYKLTVNRFVLMAIILWFLFNSVYFVLAKVRDIRIVLGAFIGIIALSFYMPFSAYYFGQRAQEARLLSIATSQGTVTDGRIVIGAKEKTVSADSDMKGIIFYLNQFHGLNSVKSKLSDEIIGKIAIDKYGYSKAFLNQYSYYDKLFFKELLPQSENVSTNTYVGVMLENLDISIPDGYTKVDAIDNYDYSQYAYENSSFTYKGVKYDLNIDLKDKRFITKEYSPFSKETSYFGPNTFFTSDTSLLTFKVKDKVLVVTSINGLMVDGKLTEIQGITGLLFSK